MLLILISVLPVILIMLYIYYRDRYEKEPFWLLMKAFGGGILAAVSTLLFFAPLQVFFPDFESLLMEAFFRAFAGAAIPEEIFKFIFLYIIIWKNQNFNEYYDGIVYSVFVSLGFACLENIYYVTEHGMGVGIARGIFAVPSHALDGVIMGYFLSLARFMPGRRAEFLFKSLFYAILAHGIYDFLLFYASGMSESNPGFAGLLIIVFFVFVIYLWRLGFRKITSHVEASVFKN
ncbi:MAG: PrsW family intramembrane metalloprotease [Lentimicrobium sp.]|nr:PrsW family intramembrane metalloprotease [Lentimicrobium sp.]